MQATQLLTADLLDILFDGKNKEYGAYDLRKTYNNRLRNSMLIVLSLIALMVGSFFIKAQKAVEPMMVTPVIVIPDAELSAPDQDPITPPPPPAMAAIPVRTVDYAITRIVPDEDVTREDMPPEQDDITNAKISTFTTEGVDETIVGPTAPSNVIGVGTGVVVDPNSGKGNGNDKPFERVEIESKYPGGQNAWRRFLDRNLGNNYPEKALENNIQGTVVIQFIVDIDGSVSKVEAISGPDELREAAATAIRKSGKWEPAIQNGRQVKSYKKQPITFRMPND